MPKTAPAAVEMLASELKPEWAYKVYVTIKYTRIEDAILRAVSNTPDGGVYIYTGFGATTVEPDTRIMVRGEVA